MTTEQLERAKTLSAKIQTLEENLNAWKTAFHFAADEAIGIKYMSNTGCGASGAVPVSAETFKIVKALNVSYWEQKLAGAKAEFERL